MPTAKPPKQPPPPIRDAAREKKLADALRANLRRRKSGKTAVPQTEPDAEEGR